VTTDTCLYSCEHLITIMITAQVLASEDARASVLNTSDSDHAASIRTSDGVSLPDGDATDGESSQKLNGQKCPPRFSTKVSTVKFSSSSSVKNCQNCCCSFIILCVLSISC